MMNSERGVRPGRKKAISPSVGGEHEKRHRNRGVRFGWNRLPKHGVPPRLPAFSGRGHPLRRLAHAAGGICRTGVCRQAAANELLLQPQKACLPNAGSVFLRAGTVPVPTAGLSRGAAAAGYSLPGGRLGRGDFNWQSAGPVGGRAKRSRIPAHAPKDGAGRH